jgi:tRNA/tmRNA/rRNA uracil-C5-methylase (TrmA/RlmC/RlmD family)
MIFSEILRNEAKTLSPGSRGPIPLSCLDYAQELAVKDKAFKLFWEAHRLPQQPSPVIPSPKPRHYRTTTKRHALFQNGRLRLRFSPADANPKDAAEDPSILEPAEHLALYSFISEKLNEPFFRELAGNLNYAVLRGSYARRCVIINVRALNGPIVKQAKILGKHLPECDKGAISCFLFVDPKQSPYYLDTGCVGNGIKIKKLFGPELLCVGFGGGKYKYPPVVFSQVNESMVPVMLSKAKELLSPSMNEHLVDLYCGYGLFTHYLAPFYAHACGLEASHESVAAAESNGRFFPAGKRTAFHAVRIESGSFTHKLPGPGCHPEACITDPPRQGMPAQAVAALCRRGPVKVVEACCGTDEIPGQVAAFRSNGYNLKTAMPLDMFAGTPHLETLLLFTSRGKQDRATR